MWTLLLVACAPEPVPTHATLPQAVALADEGLARWPADGLAPDWIQTVWVSSVQRAGQRGDDARYAAYARAWAEAEEPGPFVSSDSLSPALVWATLAADDPSFDGEAVFAAADAYLDAAPRAGNGAIEHWTDDATFGVPDQVWVDSQYMFGLYLLERWRGTGDRAPLDRFVEQYLAFAELLRDPEDALYRHAWDDVAGVNVPADEVYWARGNAWVLVSGVELLARVDADDPAAEAVRPLWLAHARAVADAQRADGLWSTVLNEPQGDDPANYPETSGSALLAAAIARGLALGELDEATFVPVLARAVAGVETRVVDGVVYGTSHGTIPGDYAYYVGVDQGEGLMLGHGAVVRLFAEADGLPKEVAP